jgi:hypothetical protein
MSGYSPPDYSANRDAVMDAIAHEVHDYGDKRLAQIVDAIPNGPMIRLLIERGALVLEEPLYDEQLHPLTGRYRVASQ